MIGLVCNLYIKASLSHRLEVTIVFIRMSETMEITEESQIVRLVDEGIERTFQATTLVCIVNHYVSTIRGSVGVIKEALRYLVCLFCASYFVEKQAFIGGTLAGAVQVNYYIHHWIMTSS